MLPSMDTENSTLHTGAFAEDAEDVKPPPGLFFIFKTAPSCSTVFQINLSLTFI